ncbi:hypothetical protein AgCh_038878 [Apium graveolens]
MRGNKERIVFSDEVFMKKGFRNWKRALERFKDHVRELGCAHGDCETQYFAYIDQRQSIVHSASDAKDGVRDSSVKEQMPFILQYVDKFGEVLEYFIGVTHISDTSAISLKLSVENILTKHGLSISKVRGQGYDEALNMREELNGMKTVILKENPSAGYVHCFAHQLQLVVVSVTKEIQVVSQFFDYVPMIVNMVGASCKRNDALRQKQLDQIVQNLEKSEKTTGTRMYQEISLARPGETRWGSHYKTIIHILAMWSTVLEVLGDVYNDGICKK